MPISRTAFNALVDDTGNNTDGTIWNKAQIAAVILDPIDTLVASFAAPVWVTPTFNAGYFFPTAGSWTVDAADVVTFAYTVNGKTYTLNVYLQTTSTAGTPPILRITLPGGYTIAKGTGVCGLYSVGSGWLPNLLVLATAGQTYLELYRELSSNSWNNLTNLYYFRFSITLEIL